MAWHTTFSFLNKTYQLIGQEDINVIWLNSKCKILKCLIGISPFGKKERDLLHSIVFSNKEFLITWACLDDIIFYSFTYLDRYMLLRALIVSIKYVMTTTPNVWEERCHQILSFNGIVVNHEMCKWVWLLSIISRPLYFYFLSMFSVFSFLFCWSVYGLYCFLLNYQV